MDKQLTYGRKQIVDYASKYCEDHTEVSILDIGAGHGNDLFNISSVISDDKSISLYAIERYIPNVKELNNNRVIVYDIDIEKDKFPFPNQSMDIVIANSVLEHVKEIFWIFSEVSRILKVGGKFIVNVPNLASFHNRVLLMLGKQPSFIYTLGPHVRGYTYSDFKNFIETDNYFKVESYKGANFYPFPPVIAKILAKIFPKLSAALILMITRTEKAGNFIQIFDTRFFETNFYCGNGKTIFDKNNIG